jgi:N-acetylglucosaminyl-diphospho-decaprenol L-rhamnosyltransferase
MNKTPDLSIVIVSHNHSAVLANCLASIFLCTATVSFTVIVIDNTCEDSTSEGVRADYPQVHLVRNKAAKGFAANVNCGISLCADSRYILLLNPDTECLPGLLDALVDFMDHNPDVGIAGPKLLNMDGTLQASCRRFSTPATILMRGLHFDSLVPHSTLVRQYLMEEFDHHSAGDVDWVTGAALIVRRTATATIGLMDDVRYFLYSEDQDWCLRMWRAGWRVCYVPQARARHALVREGIRKPWSKAGRHQLVSALRMFHKFGWKLDRKGSAQPDSRTSQ